MPVTVTLVDHPLVADSLARIRDRDTPNSLFRNNLERIGTLLLAEATRSLRTVDGTVETPLTTAPARRLAVQPVIVPDPARRARLRARRPGADARTPTSASSASRATRRRSSPTRTSTSCRSRSPAGPVIVIDPMLATGGSLVHTVALLTARGAPVPIIVVCALAAPEGIQRLRDEGLDLHVITAAIDDHLNEHAFIVPGLGDAGDRQFGSGG